MPIVNTDRSVGTMTSGFVTRLYGGAGLPDDMLHLDFKGAAGQSFGAFLCHGITLH
ncbi:hypothetical protein, partial [Enterococcus faecalis]|uniref:GltB/FmdC/FwdC-like GXGXG domain-containing protein n=1 Tax=Enterococcus faecalis TaxID=1351 RepID=UPI003986762B